MHQTAFPLTELQASAGRRPHLGAKRAHPWHALEAASVTQLLEVDPCQGLTPWEVATRRISCGPNNTDALGSRRITRMLVLLFLSTVIGFLLTAAILNRAAGDSVEAFSVLVVVVIGAIVGFAYLLKAARALDAMHDATRAVVQVRREGRETKIKGEELVPGDIFTISAGDLVPADARLIEAARLQVHESSVTGKSTIIEKRTSQVNKDAPLDERRSMIYLGTEIGSGSGVAVVVATGVQTELGKIAVCDN